MAKIIPLSSRTPLPRARPSGAEADVLYPEAFERPAPQEIKRTLGLGAPKQFYVNATSIQTGRKARLDGPYPSKVAAEQAKRRLELEASGDLMLSVEPG